MAVADAACGSARRSLPCPGGTRVAGDPTPRGSGEPLSPATRAWAEPRFGRSLGDVRVHIGSQANAAAVSVSARAFAVGNHITFASGGYSPDTSSGQKLLAHEIAHVLRQPAAGGRPRVHRQVKGQVDTSNLPDGVNFQVLADGSVLISHAWLLSDPELRREPSNELAAPGRVAEILNALRLSHLSWIEARDVSRISQSIGFTGVDAGVASRRYQIAFSVYRVIGPPPNVDVLVTRSGKGLAVILRQSLVVSEPIELASRSKPVASGTRPPSNRT